MRININKTLRISTLVFRKMTSPLYVFIFPQLAIKVHLQGVEAVEAVEGVLGYLADLVVAQVTVRETQQRD